MDRKRRDEKVERVRELFADRRFLKDYLARRRARKPRERRRPRP